MGRTHVHFGTGLLAEDRDEAGARQGENEQAAVISGMRSDAELLVFVDVEGSLRDAEEEEGRQPIRAGIPGSG